MRSLSRHTTELGKDTNSFHFASTFHSILHPQRQKTGARLPSTHPRQKPVPSQTLVQARDATRPRGTEPPFNSNVQVYKKIVRVNESSSYRVMKKHAQGDSVLVRDSEEFELSGVRVIEIFLCIFFSGKKQTSVMAWQRK